MSGRGTVWGELGLSGTDSKQPEAGICALLLVILSREGIKGGKACGMKGKAPSQPSCAAQSCWSPTHTEERRRWKNPADWNKNHRNNPGKARRCSLMGSHGRLHLPPSTQVLQHDASEQYVVCKSLLLLSASRCRQRGNTPLSSTLCSAEPGEPLQHYRLQR